MFVIRQLEDAVYDCEKGCAIDECNDDAYNSLDAAVALYTGSLQVTQSDNGIMLYDLAERRCSNFNTCDDDLSKVNRALFSAFNRMQESLVSRNCNDALTTKGRITQLMYIPLIQGALLASFFNSQLGDASLRTEGRGATFAASVLPIVHACNAEDASIIYENTRVGRTTSSNFTAVKIAFERNYACLGLTCADVGGIWNRAQMDYFDDAAPCMDAVPSVTVRPTGMPSSPPPVTTVPTSSPMNTTTEPTLPDAFPNVTESPSPIPQGTETPVPVDRLPTIAPTPLTTNPPLERSQVSLSFFYGRLR